MTVLYQQLLSTCRGTYIARWITALNTAQENQR